jgi:uncharacterized protein (DUF2141 family)
LLSSVLVSGAEAGELRLIVDGCIPGKLVRVGVYNTASGFADDPDGRRALRSADVRAEGQVLALTLVGLAPGKYALAAFADGNGNGRLDRNWAGMPTEPYGFSRDARALFGPPDFEAARVEVGADAVTETIHLK